MSQRMLNMSIAGIYNSFSCTYLSYVHLYVVVTSPIQGVNDGNLSSAASTKKYATIGTNIADGIHSH